MPSIADAYVELHVDGDNLDGEVRSSVRATQPGGDKESDRVGKSFGSRVAAGFLSGFTNKIKPGMSKMGKEIQKGFKGLNPKGLMIPALIAAVPLLTSTVSALSGALVSFTGAVVQAGGASLAFVGVVGSLIQAKLALKVATSGLTEALKGTEGAMAKLSPAGRELVKSIKGLAPEWNAVKKSVQQATFAGVGQILTKIGKTTLPTLRRGLTDTGKNFNILFKTLGRFAQSEYFVRKFGQAMDGNNKIFRVLEKAAVPVLHGILNLFTALQPSGLRLSETILKAARAFGAWSSKTSTVMGVQAFMDRAFKSAKNLWGIFKNLGATIRNVFGAATPTGDGILKTLNDLTKRLADFTSLASSKNAIADWAERGTQVTGKLFSVLGRIGQALLPLFNPNIAGGFLTIFEKAMPSITGIIKVIQGGLQPVLQGIGDAFAENGPKIAGLVQAMAPLLKGVGMVLGELIKQTIGTLGTVATILTPVIRIISNFLGPIIQRFAPIIASVIFAFTNWSSVLIKFIPIVGKYIAPLAKLAEWIWGRVGPAFKMLGRVGGVAMRGLTKVFSAFGAFLKGPVKAYWNGFTLTIKLAMLVVRRVVSVGWRFIKTIFSTYLKVIGTVIRIYVAVWKAVIGGAFRVIRTVVSVAWRAITAVIRVGVRIIRAVITTGFNAVKGVISAVWGAVRKITAGAWAKLYSLTSSGVNRVVGFIRRMPGQIIHLASNFLSAGKKLGHSVIEGIQDGINATGGLLSDIGSKIKSAINSALGLPITLGKGPLKFTIPAFAQGGVTPGGLAKVGERGPEIIAAPRGSRVLTASETKKAVAGKDGGQRWPRKLILRIGARDFVAYVSEIADDRIDAADSLAYQGT